MSSILQRLPIGKSPFIMYNHYMIKTYEKICLYCKKQFTSDKQRSKYCSVECHYAGSSANNRILKTFTCQYCGDVFTRHKKGRKPVLFCSRACWRAGRSGENAWNHSSIQVFCKYCQKPFQQISYLREQGYGLYCSRRCAAKATANVVAKARENGKEVPCGNCGTMIYRARAKIMKVNFCSPQCHGLYHQRRRITIICAYCGEEKRVKPSYLNKGAKYCSKICWIRGSAETSLETLGYALLDVMNFTYQRQTRLGKFIPDAFIPSLNMAVLFDGDYWHNMPDHKDRDERFNAYASRIGVLVVRVRESELKKSYQILRSRIIQVGGLLDAEVPLIPLLFHPPISQNGVVQLHLNLSISH
jgi:very-short-patch-repair endonuclease